ncbi:MAG: deoxyribose-phosphate aldolase [Granulosicoccus sp.]
MDTFHCARLTLGLLDLTDLSGGSDEPAIAKLCDDAVTRHGPVAAICIWPKYVAYARKLLGDSSPVKIATVVNFPSGSQPCQQVLDETVAAVKAGADEIDLVMPYNEFKQGNAEAVTSLINEVRAVSPSGCHLKVILETGMLESESLVTDASLLVISTGADFIKTSTGKVAVNATPEVADLMLEAIRQTGGKTGFKAAGGVRSVVQAKVYLDIAVKKLGIDWVTAEHFRFGASGLLVDVLNVLDSTENQATASPTTQD